MDTGANKASALAAGCERERTVREEINAAIEQHQRQITRLLQMRDTTPDPVLDMPQRRIAALAWPDQNPF